MRKNTFIFTLAAIVMAIYSLLPAGMAEGSTVQKVDIVDMTTTPVPAKVITGHIKSVALQPCTFTIDGSTYQVITSIEEEGVSGAHSVISRWNGDSFEEHQVIFSDGIYDVESFTIGSEYFLAMVGSPEAGAGGNATFFKWDGAGFVEYQVYPKDTVRDIQIFEIEGQTYLALFSREEESGGSNVAVYAWRGGCFERYEVLLTEGVCNFDTFIIDGTYYAAIGKTLGDTGSGGDIYIYRWGGISFEEAMIIPVADKYDLIGFKMAKGVVAR